MKKDILYHPTVCPVRDTYQIMVPVSCEIFLSVKIGENEYFSHINGIRVSTAPVQRITVPMDELDKAKKYTLVCRKLIERKAYFTETEDAYEIEYNFRPVEKTTGIEIYHIADVHGWADNAVAAAQLLKKNYDVLVINGDIADHSNTVENLMVAYKIASSITKGEYPCVISRGNHDLRGNYAEKLADFMPGDNSKSYYTFRLGCIWCILVDTGEDKNDISKEYGYSIACHQFRREETKMIEETIKNAKEEYEADGVKYRFIISHVPFTFQNKEPFNIEEELFTQWAKLMKDNIKPQLMICGHKHETGIFPPGCERDALGSPCTVLLGSDVNYEGEYFTGMAVTINEIDADVVFNTNHEVLEEHKVLF